MTVCAGGTASFPQLILPCRQHQRHTRFGPESLAFLPSHRQSFLLVDPIYALVVHHPLRSSVLLLPPQHFMHPPVAKTRTFALDFPQLCSQRCVLAFSPPVMATPPVHP